MPSGSTSACARSFQQSARTRSHSVPGSLRVRLEAVPPRRRSPTCGPRPAAARRARRGGLGERRGEREVVEVRKRLLALHHDESGDLGRRAERVQLRPAVAEHVVALVPGLVARAGEVAVRDNEPRPIVRGWPGQGQPYSSQTTLPPTHSTPRSGPQRSQSAKNRRFKCAVAMANVTSTGRSSGHGKLGRFAEARSAPRPPAQGRGLSPERAGRSTPRRRSGRHGFRLPARRHAPARRRVSPDPRGGSSGRRRERPYRPRPRRSCRAVRLRPARRIRRPRPHPPSGLLGPAHQGGPAVGSAQERASAGDSKT